MLFQLYSLRSTSLALALLLAVNLTTAGRILVNFLGLMVLVFKLVLHILSRIEVRLTALKTIIKSSKTHCCFDKFTSELFVYSQFESLQTYMLLRSAKLSDAFVFTLCNYQSLL